MHMWLCSRKESGIQVELFKMLPRIRYYSRVCVLAALVRPVCSEQMFWIMHTTVWPVVCCCSEL